MKPVNLYTWSLDVLRALDIPANANNTTALIAWAIAEGGSNANSADYNPLNTTLTTPGVVRTINSHGVKAYATYDDGLEATVRTLRLEHYTGVVAALRDGTARDVAAAVAASPWGTGRGVYGSLERAETINEFTPGAMGITDIGQRLAGVILDGLPGPNPIDAADDVGDALGQLQDVAELLTSWDTWRRVLLFLGGAGLAVAGVVIIARDAA